MNDGKIMFRRCSIDWFTRCHTDACMQLQRRTRYYALGLSTHRMGDRAFVHIFRFVQTVLRREHKRQIRHDVPALGFELQDMLKCLLRPAILLAVLEKQASQIAEDIHICTSTE